MSLLPKPDCVEVRLKNSLKFVVAMKPSKALLQGAPGFAFVVEAIWSVNESHRFL